MRRVRRAPARLSISCNSRFNSLGGMVVGARRSTATPGSFLASSSGATNATDAWVIRLRTNCATTSAAGTDGAVAGSARE
ncbi:hypothetical protein [Luteitalea pratensis]|uniref:hypothetical protein n=1 Tax=Luteitalea pratensis TaxID=1855912 RepID=UPI000D73E918|nr:hypothetical protein [Luteitalea pratensis]